jgi:hypothetical protein
MGFSATIFKAGAAGEAGRTVTASHLLKGSQRLLEQDPASVGILHTPRPGPISALPTVAQAPGPGIL